VGAGLAAHQKSRAPSGTAAPLLAELAAGGGGGGGGANEWGAFTVGEQPVPKSFPGSDDGPEMMMPAQAVKDAGPDLFSQLQLTR
jgi:hypothetical protein